MNFYPIDKFISSHYDNFKMDFIYKGKVKAFWGTETLLKHNLNNYLQVFPKFDL